MESNSVGCLQLVYTLPLPVTHGMCARLSHTSAHPKRVFKFPGAPPLPPSPPPPPSDRCHLCIVCVRRDCSRHPSPSPLNPPSLIGLHTMQSVLQLSQKASCAASEQCLIPPMCVRDFLLVAPFKPLVTNGKLSAEHVSSHLIYLFV